MRWREAADDDAAIELVGEEIDHIEAEGYETPARARRDHVAPVTRPPRETSMGFSSWEQRDEHSIVCETVHRVKGLEFDFVVLVAAEDVTDLLLYVGLSRAVVGFSLVAPAAVAARLGIAPVSSAS